jgi:hypothetical protein
MVDFISRVLRSISYFWVGFPLLSYETVAGITPGVSHFLAWHSVAGVDQTNEVWSGQLGGGNRSGQWQFLNARAGW